MTNDWYDTNEACVCVYNLLLLYINGHCVLSVIIENDNV